MALGRMFGQAVDKQRVPVTEAPPFRKGPQGTIRRKDSMDIRPGELAGPATVPTIIFLIKKLNYRLTRLCKLWH